MSERPVTVIFRFDPPDAPWGRGHRGVDLASAVGRPVNAPAAAVVTFAGTVADRPVMVLQHDNGMRSTVEPVDAAVAVGTRIERGGRVGNLSSAVGHCRPRICLHWGVRNGETYVDPLSLVWSGPPVLLPLTRADAPPSPRVSVLLGRARDDNRRA